MKKKILIVFGTRPEAIKLVPVILKLKEDDQLVCRICVTAQHREMLDQVLNLFGISPDYDLNIMKDNQSLFDVTADGIRDLERILRKEAPNLILIQGDTTTTFLAGLASYYLRIKIGHVEAGLRSKDKFNPFPEEINRRITDCLADLYFAPTENAKTNLIQEGFDKSKIFVTGNTVIDALLMTIEKQKNEETQLTLKKRFRDDYGLSFDNQKIILVTGHRRESFGKDLENICEGIKNIAQNNPDVLIVYPVHLNPNVQSPVRKILNNIKNIHLIEPLDYFSFVWLMSQAYIILTDSGGIQEEAPSIRKPVLVMRKITERPEGIEAGTAKLVGTLSEKIFQETQNLLDHEDSYQAMANAANPYGDGKSSERIIDIIKKEI